MRKSFTTAPLATWARLVALITAAITVVTAQSSVQIQYYTIIDDNAIWAVPEGGIPLGTPFDLYFRLTGSYADFNQMTSEEFMQNFGFYMKRPWFMWDRMFWPSEMAPTTVEPGSFLLRAIDPTSWRDEKQSKIDYSSLEMLLFPALNSGNNERFSYSGGGAAAAPVSARDQQMASGGISSGRGVFVTRSESTGIVAPSRGNVYRLRLNVPNTMAMFLRSDLQFIIKSQSAWHRLHIRHRISMTPPLPIREPGLFSDTSYFLKSISQRFRQFAVDLDRRQEDFMEIQRILRGHKSAAA